MDNGEVIQIGNIVDVTKIGFKNPQRGRVYSLEGIAPCLYCFEGGGLEPKIVVYESERDIRTIEKQGQAGESSQAKP